MEKKTNNPVEGRLSMPSPTGTEPHIKSPRKKTNYGVERLGITSDAISESNEPAPELTEKQKTPAPHTVPAPPITVSPVSKEPARQAEAVEAPETEHRYAVSSNFSRYKDLLGRRKTKKILLLAGIPVIALTLILWISLAGEETAPQAASATEQSSPDRPATKHANKNAVKPPQNSLETAKRPIKHESGQAISAATPARSALREVFKFLAEMKPAPKTTAPVPAQASPVPKPDKPQDATPKPVEKKPPVITAAASQLGLRLGGIMRGTDGKIALINNRSVKIGQTVNNAKVVHIGDFSVEVEVKGKRYLVAISSPSPPPEKTSDENEDEDESSDSDDEKAESKTEDKDKKKEKEKEE